MEEAKREKELNMKAQMEMQQKLMLVMTGEYRSPAPYDDGDQSPLKKDALRILKHQWARGMDYGLWIMDYDNFDPMFTHLSDWMKNLFKGDLAAMTKEIEKTSEKDLKKLLERRESLLNVSAIFHVVIGARTLCGEHDEFADFWKQAGNMESDHMTCFLKLIELGARTDAKDVAGYTPLHHCLTKF